MNCELTQTLLVAYLDEEVTPSERTLIQAHLSNCTVCLQELTLLSTAQGRVRSALQHRAGHAVPSSEAWNWLEARLAKEAQPSSPYFAAWLQRLAASTHIFGDITMRKRLALSAMIAILVFATVAVFMANTVTSVSAREILDRASVAQSVTAISEGVRHIKIENYFLKDLADSTGVKTILDSYGDLQNGNFWNVTFDSNGAVLDVSAYDGTYTYSQDYSVERVDGEPLKIYRTLQNKVDLKPVGSGGVVDDKAMFEQMHSDPNVRLLGKEIWDDGRTVFVLQSHQQMKAVANGLVEQPEGLVTIYFDTNTYKQVGYRMTMLGDGAEILLMSQKVLVDEILPAETSAPFNLDSLQGVVVVDDLNRKHGDLLPEVISEQELAARISTAYLLKTIPAGYSLEISEPQIKAGSDEPYIYIASYRNEANDYFVIQSGTGLPSDTSIGSCTVSSGVKTCDTEQTSTADDKAEEIYTTASGLVLHFMEDFRDPSGKQYTSAVVKAPDETTFTINSTLPREMVKVWVEDLAPVQK